MLQKSGAVQAGKSGDWLTERLQPAETAMAAMAAILWMSLIGSVIASQRMIALVGSAFNVPVVGITAVVAAIGGATVRYWLVSIPLWGGAFIGSMLWALSIPEKRQTRLCGMVFGLAMALFVTLLASYIPFAHAAGSIVRPFENLR